MKGAGFRRPGRTHDPADQSVPPLLDGERWRELTARTPYHLVFYDPMTITRVKGRCPLCVVLSRSELGILLPAAATWSMGASPRNTDP